MTEPIMDGDRRDRASIGLAAGATDNISASAALASRNAVPGIVPDWLVNLAALGWRVIAVAGLAVVLWYLAVILWTVTASIAVAVVIAALFAPMALGLRARGRSRTAAAAIVWTTSLAGITAVVLLLGIAFLPYVADLLANLEAAVLALQADVAALGLPEWVVAAVRGLLDLLRQEAGDAESSLVTAAANVVTVAVLATFLVFFFLRDGDRAWMWVFQALSDQKRERITTAGEDALTRVGGYLRGTTILSGLTALTDLAFMLVLGVPMAVPLAVLIFFSGYIPYFGGIVTTFIMLGVTYASLGIGPVITMLVLIAIRNAILGYGVRPAVYGRTVSIHPALVLVVLPAGFAIAGVIGLFAAVPITAVILAVSSATVSIVTPDPRPQLPGLVPAWLDRVAQWSWRLLVCIGLVTLLVLVGTAVPMVVIPILLAVIVAATLDPVVQWMVKRGRSRPQAAALSVGGGFLGITLMLLVAMTVLVRQVGETQAAASAGAESVNAAAGGELGLVAQAVSTIGLDGVRTIVSLADSAAAAIVVLVLGTMLSFYFLRDGRRLWDALLVHALPEVVPQFELAGRRAFEVLGGYMFGTAAISFVGAASQLVIMLILGIPLALPIFVLSFFLCFIPYIGGFISTGAALLVTIAYGDPAAVAVMVVWTLVFNIVTGNIVGPLVYGKTVHLHPAVVLVAIPAGGAIAGVVGMFLVVPAIGVVSATWRIILAIMGTRTQSIAVQAGSEAGTDAGSAAPAAPGEPSPAQAEASVPG